jgi:hypothetical protein
MTVDPGTGLTVLGAALGSKELVERILGPTADYLGIGMKDWTELRVKNVGRIFENARRILGSKIDSPETVPPKVLKGILDDGSFCDDELGAEYFGGVLASSRSAVGRDDRGAAFLSLIARLSTYQIRSHFFFYSAVRILYEGSTENLGISEGRDRLKTFIPLSAYAPAMEFTEKEKLETIVSHVMFGLAREPLIDSTFQFGPAEHIKQHYPLADSAGLLFAPSALGAELFLWAHGRGDVKVRDLIKPEMKLTCSARITTGPGIRSTISRRESRGRKRKTIVKPQENRLAALATNLLKHVCLLMKMVGSAGLEPATSCL